MGNKPMKWSFRVDLDGDGENGWLVADTGRIPNLYGEKKEFTTLLNRINNFDELLEALKKYGRHSFNCYRSAGECVCELGEIIKKAEVEK